MCKSLNKRGNGLLVSLNQQSDYNIPNHVDDDSGYSFFIMNKDTLSEEQT